MQLPAIVYVATYLLLARSCGNASFTQDVNVKKQKKIIVVYSTMQILKQFVMCFLHFYIMW